MHTSERLFLSFLLILTVTAFAPALVKADEMATLGPVDPSLPIASQPAPANAPIFVENVGQFTSDVLFKAQGGGIDAFLSEDGVQFFLSETAADAPRFSPRHGALPTLGSNQRTSVALRFEGANPNLQIAGILPLDVSLSYFKGRTFQSWYTDVPAWGGVRYSDLYPGVDLEITGLSGRWQWQLVVHDAAKAAAYLPQIALAVEGAALSQEGLQMQIETAQSTFALPLIAVEGAGFDLASPSIENGLIKRPFQDVSMASDSADVGLYASSDLVYSSYLGGDYDDGGAAIAVDDTGNIYVAGYTASALMIYDGFVKKLSADGSTLIYASYIGGSQHDWINDLDLDDTGCAYVTGKTWSDDFPATSGAYDESYNANSESGDAFVAKLNATGTGLSYATYLGGDGDEIGSGIAVSGGLAYVTGETEWTDGDPFTTTVGAYDTTHGGGLDIFCVQLDAVGSDVGYATFVGGTERDVAHDIAVDSVGNAYIVGDAGSTGLATTDAYDETLGGEQDALLVKLSSDGSTLVYASYLGGDGSDWAEAIALDDLNRAYLTGRTRSFSGTLFPTTTGAYGTSGSGSIDIFVTRFAADGAALSYSTLVGGSDPSGSLPEDVEESGAAIAIDNSYNTYVVGTTDAPDFPTVNGYAASPAGYLEAFLVKLDDDASDLLYSSYLGGSDDDWAYDMALAATDEIYMTGDTLSDDFPLVDPFDSVNGGDYYYDAFVSKFNTSGAIEYHLTMDTNAGTISPGNGWYAENTTVTIEATAPSAGTGEQYLWDGWTGVGTGSYSGLDNPAQVTMSGDVSETAVWTHQYTLTVGTEPAGLATISGTGWKEEGSLAQTGTAPATAMLGDVEYEFVGWRVDGTPQAGSNPIEVLMDGPHTATAYYTETQYALSMSTNAGTVSPGDGLYAPNTSVEIMATAPNPVTGERYLWDGWTGVGTGSYTGLDNPALVTMATDISETASWTHQYSLTVGTEPAGLATISGAGWKEASSLAQTGTAPATVIVGDVQYQFVEWRVDGVSQGTTNPIEVLMDGPHTAIAHYTDTELQYPPEAQTISPNTGIGLANQGLIFTATYADDNGWDDLDEVELLFSDSPSQITDSVRVKYDVQNNLLYLQNRWEEGLWEPSGGLVPGADEQVKQGLAMLEAQGTTVNVSGTQLTVSFAISLTHRFGGLHNSYMRATDLSGGDSGWVAVGDWRVNNTPEPVYFGAAGDTIEIDDRIRYGMSYRDADGIADMDELYLLITDTAPSDAMPGLATSEGLYAGAALLRYDVGNDRMYLRNIKDTKWKPGGGMIPNTKDKEKWPHAILRGVKSWTEEVTDKALYVRYNLQLRAPLAGENRVWMRAVDVHGVSHGGDSGWMDMGTLTVGSQAGEAVPQVTGLIPDAGIGLAEEVVIFDATYGDGNGWEDLDQAELLFSDSTGQITDAVRVRYDVQSDALYLQDRWQEDVWEGGVAPGTENAFQHGLVTVYPGLSSVQTSGEQLTVSYALGFKSNFGGLHESFAKAQDQIGQSSGWVDVGQWRVNNTPEPVYFGAAGDTIAVDDRVRYGMSYRDADGIEDMDELYLLITDTAPSDLLPGLATSEGVYAGAALLRYDVGNDLMYLRNIKDTKWKPAGGIIPNSKEKEKWPHVILRGKKSWTEPSTEKALYVRYNLQLREPLAGENRVWMRAIDVHGQAQGGDSGWVDMGTLTISP